MDFTSITSHIRSWVLFLLWLCLFIPSGVISPVAYWATYWPGKFIFQCPIFLPFHTVHGVLKARKLNWFAISSPVDHILSQLSTMTHVSWVAPQGMAHSFFVLGEAVVSICLPSDALSQYLPSYWGFSDLGCGYLLMAGPAKHSWHPWSWTWGISSQPPLLTLDRGISFQLLATPVLCS